MLLAKHIAISFVDAINSQDMEALNTLMGDKHIFVDAQGNFYQGCTQLRQAWREFFRSFPNYKMYVEQIIENDNMVVLIGCASGDYSACPKDDETWHLPTIWTAKVEGTTVQEWRMYADTSSIGNAMHRYN